MTQSAQMRLMNGFLLVLAVVLGFSAAGHAGPAGVDFGRGAANLSKDITTSSSVTTLDLCAPCYSGAQCLASYCATPTPGRIGYCTQKCTDDSNCPSGFSCTGQPGDPTTCQTTDTSSSCLNANAYAGPLNTICALPALSTTSSPVTRLCQTGLTCYYFPADSSGNQVGVCVQACSSTDATAVCNFGQTCCYGTNTDGTCQTTSTATGSAGGCFLIQDPGAGCSLPVQSYCTSTATCAYTQTADAAKCYPACNADGSCPVGGVCANIGSASVCCDETRFINSDITTCQPAAGRCRREVGVACSTNEDCRLNLCLKYQEQAVCALTCQADSDCPGAAVDVNGDGIPDGGFTCRTFSTASYCWPTKGPISAPTCATVSDAPVDTARHGCQCNQTQGTQPWAAAVFATFLATVRGVRRRARRCNDRVRCTWR